jgi:hypothetical protein
MQAGLSDHVWSLGEIVQLLEQAEQSEISRLTQTKR